MTLRESRPASPTTGAAQQVVDLVSPLFGGLVPLRVRGGWLDHGRSLGAAPT